MREYSLNQQLAEFTMDAELCYLAGHFDGEGCIYTARAGGNKYSHVHIAVGCTYLPVLEIYQRRFGGNIYKIDKKHYKPHYKQIWRWALGHRVDCARFLLTMSPLLKEKHQQAEEALDKLTRVMV